LAGQLAVFYSIFDGQFLCSVLSFRSQSPPKPAGQLAGRLTGDCPQNLSEIMETFKKQDLHHAERLVNPKVLAKKTRN
jgi:hypothetical protein